VSLLKISTLDNFENQPEGQTREQVERWVSARMGVLSWAKAAPSDAAPQRVRSSHKLARDGGQRVEPARDDGDAGD